MKTVPGLLFIILLAFAAACDSDTTTKTSPEQMSVVSSYPRDSQSDVFPDTAAEIRFSLALELPLPENAVTVSAESGDVPCDCETAESDTMIVCSPHEKLAENASYTVTLSSGIRSSTGKQLIEPGFASGYSYQFTTLNRATTGILPVFCSYESKYLPAGASLAFTTPLDTAVIYTGTSSDQDASAPDSWALSDTVTAPAGSGALKVFAQARDGGAVIGGTFSFVYEVVDAFPGVDASQAITGEAPVSRDDAAITVRAQACSEFTRGLDRTTAGAIDDPESVLGAASGIVNIGNAGSITFAFEDQHLGDGAAHGPDLALFENGFLTPGGLVAEYGYVEVSSDGYEFLRFDTATMRDPLSVADPSTAMTGWDTTLDWGMMGRYPAGYGDTFDLAWLRNKRAVVEGKIDLGLIRYVRIVDIIGIDEARLMGPDTSSSIPRADHKSLISTDLGNYDSLDSFGNVIFDEYPTVGTGGLDITGIGGIVPLP